VVRIIYAEAARKRPGREYAWWALITLIVQQATDVDVLAAAVVEHWIEASPSVHSVRHTAESWRVAQPSGRGHRPDGVCRGVWGETLDKSPVLLHQTGLLADAVSATGL
jgi:hypothetical protein